MNEAQPIPPDASVIPVAWDSETMTLNLSTPTHPVRQGDLVFWQITGLPDGWSPWVQITEVENVRKCFRSLSQGAASVWGLLSDDAPIGPLRYQISIQRGLAVPNSNPSSIWSRPASLEITSPKEAKHHIFEILPASSKDPNIAPEDLTRDQVTHLEVEPAIYQIRPKDTVVWDFTRIRKIQSNYASRVYFKHFIGCEEPKNLHFGPFTSLTYGDDRVIGKGSARRPGSYFFFVLVVAGEKRKIQWLNSGDPCVDDLGDPAHPGSG